MVIYQSVWLRFNYPAAAVNGAITNGCRGLTTQNRGFVQNARARTGIRLVEAPPEVEERRSHGDQQQFQLGVGLCSRLTHY